MSKQSYESVYLRQYRADHPEKVKQWELNTARNKLTQAGYEVNEPTKKKHEKLRPEDMTDEQLREALEEKRRRNRESCYRWRKKNQKHYDTYQVEYNRQYRAKQKAAREALKAEINRRQNGE